MLALFSFLLFSLINLIPSVFISVFVLHFFDTFFSFTSQEGNFLLAFLSVIIAFSSTHLFLFNLSPSSPKQLQKKEEELKALAESISIKESAAESRLQAKRIELDNEIKERSAKELLLLDEKQKESELRLKEQSEKELARLKEIRNRIIHIHNASLKDAPWLASFYADFLYTSDLDKAKYLLRKSCPAQKAADTVKQLAAEKRAAINQLKLLQYQIAVYESVAPWLEDFKDVDTDTIHNCISSAKNDTHQNDYDTVKRWLSKDEYDRLTTEAKYQLALNRYQKSQKTRWEIGRDYERYIGYLYESSGNKVEYVGATKGLQDMGRDLIVHFKSESGTTSPVIIQCKYWNEHRTVHEKHIFQLYGSMIMYRIEHNIQQVGCMFFTTAPLSDTAQKAADMLNIGVSVIPFEKSYPCIKCNINFSTGERIYHLPFDQQYDHVRIDPHRGEAYLSTVAEAEARGFRRAMRWKGNSSN